MKNVRKEKDKIRYMKFLSQVRAFCASFLTNNRIIMLTNK